MLDKMQRREFVALLLSLVLVVVATAAVLPTGPVLNVPAPQPAPTAIQPETPAPQTPPVQIEAGYRWRQGMARFVTTDISQTKATPASK